MNLKLTTATALLAFVACAGAQTNVKKSDGFSITFKTGGKDVTIIVKDSKAEAWVAGKLIRDVKLTKPNKLVQLKGLGGEYLASLTKLGKPGYITYGTPKKKAQLGINVGEIDIALSEHLGLDPKTCVIVLKVTKGQAAEKAGVRKHDIIVEIDGQKPITRKKLTEIISKRKPKDRVTFRVLRKGKDKRVLVTLGQTQTINSFFNLNVKPTVTTKNFTTSLTWKDGKFLVPGIKNWSFDATKNKPFTFSPYTTWGTPAAAKVQDLKKDVEKLRKQLTRLEKLLQTLKKQQDLK